MIQLNVVSVVYLTKRFAPPNGRPRLGQDPDHVLDRGPAADAETRCLLGDKAFEFAFAEAIATS
jgi:hypothetical protein